MPRERKINFFQGLPRAGKGGRPGIFCFSLNPLTSSAFPHSATGLPHKSSLNFQEEWELVRKAEDPKEAPQEDYDPRSLFDRLQEQKDKKQLEWDEAHKLKNQVRTIDSEEADFLDQVGLQSNHPDGLILPGHF